MSKTDYKMAAALYLLMAISMIVPACTLNMPAVVDELGTTANAAFLAGYDWHDAIICSGGFYYKYGQAFLWAIPFMVIKDMALLYKVINIINSLLLSTSIVFCYAICRRYHRMDDPRQAAVFSILAAMVPAVIYHGLFARGDVMLCTLPWPLLFFMYLGSETKEPWVRRICGILVGFLSVYAYMSHSRGIVLTIATFMTVFLILIVFRLSIVSIPFYLGTTVVSLVVDKFLTRWFKYSIWGPDGVLHASAEVFEWENLQEMFTPEGLEVVLKTFIGWMNAALISTYGLALVACLGGLMILWFWVRRKHQINMELGLSTLFGLLIFAGNVAMGIMFFFPSVKASLNFETLSRGDRLIYDRYMLAAMGLLILTALQIFRTGRKWFGARSHIFCGIGYAAAVILLARHVVYYFEELEFARKYSVNIATGCTLQSHMGILKENLPMQMVVSMAVACLFFLVILILHYFKKDKIMLAVLLAACGLTYLGTQIFYRVEEDDNKQKDAEAAIEFMLDVEEITDQYELVYSKAKNIRTKHWQFPLSNYKIINSNYKPLRELNNVFIMYSELPPAKSLQPEYKYFTVDQMPEDVDDAIDVLIKGEDLAEALEDMGYTLTEFHGKEPRETENPDKSPKDDDGEKE